MVTASIMKISSAYRKHSFLFVMSLRFLNLSFAEFFKLFCIYLKYINNPSMLNHRRRLFRSVICKVDAFCFLLFYIFSSYFAPILFKSSFTWCSHPTLGRPHLFRPLEFNFSLRYIVVAGSTFQMCRNPYVFRFDSFIFISFSIIFDLCALSSIRNEPKMALNMFCIFKFMSYFLTVFS